jgi:poly-gamma-glutamate synthesis protein (capsule biosynthesis protein)
MRSQWLGGFGLISLILLTVGALDLDRRQVPAPSVPESMHDAPTRVLRLLAVGDVNLGRTVGQEILNGDTLFPFASVREEFARYDVVFANLECTLSDQGGETQHPRNNLIFTGPPEGAHSLRKAGVTVVSTANNHALDYGVAAQRQTMQSLTEAGVCFVGTSTESQSLFKPVIVTRKGISIAFFACTDVMNIEDPMWKRYVAAADTSKLLPSIRAYRDSADFIVVSYHGGEEYRDRPTNRTVDFAHSVIHSGADLFLGHHPHVPYGVEDMGGRYIVYSLGNFVFYQPDRYWTQRSFGFSAELVKDASGTRVLTFDCLPVSCGLQPRFLTNDPEANRITERIERLSSLSIARHEIR